MINLRNIRNTNQSVRNTTTNITRVNQSNEGAVVSGGGPVTFVQSNSNNTTNYTSNVSRIR